MNDGFDNTPFAEIEIEAEKPRDSAGNAVLRFFSSVTPAQPIGQRTIDPLRQKFFDMRSLASGKPFARNDAELFYKQAKFMEDFTDDYDGYSKFFMYFPYYQHMSYEQLRTYFTWRAKCRRGEVPLTAVSYAFLYIYELLSGIGVEDAADGLSKLMAVWKTYSGSNIALDEHIPRWIKDYHIYYELPHDFVDYAINNDLLKYYSPMMIIDAYSENSLELLSSISSYNILKSKFYNDGNQQLLRDCFDDVLCGIRELCERGGAVIEDLLIYRVSNRTPWYPFKQALFHNKQEQRDRKVKLPGQERYFCQDNRWTASLPIFYSSQKEFLGYILKKTESCLRQLAKYKYKLAAESKGAGATFRELRDMGLSLAQLDEAIEKSVEGYYRDLTRTVVTIDHANLERIREEALGTQEKLVVAEEDYHPRSAFASSKHTFADPSSAQSDSIATFADSLSADIDEDLQTAPPDGFTYEDDGWAAFKNALTPTELEALSLALRDSAGVKAYADANGIMLEVLADSINEKAADYIGDSILETDGGMTIYDEYKDNVSEIIN